VGIRSDIDHARISQSLFRDKGVFDAASTDLVVMLDSHLAGEFPHDFDLLCCLNVFVRCIVARDKHYLFRVKNSVDADFFGTL